MKFPEQFRWSDVPKPYSTNPGDGFGVFVIPGPCSRNLRVIATDGIGDSEEWEHVSVSIFERSNRCPNWEEMCFIKDLFWSDDEIVMQLHPAKSDYVNNHPGCLHLWRPVGKEIPMPPKEFV